MTDDEKERVAIEVEHLPPEEAQKEYNRRVNKATARAEGQEKV